LQTTMYTAMHTGTVHDLVDFAAMERNQSFSTVR
jgi:hypothetical protein